MQTAWRIVRIGLLAYLGILLLMMLFEESLIFLPSKYPQGDWDTAQQRLPIEDAQFTSADGTRLHGWYVDHANPRAVMLFAHGNAGNITHRREVLRLLHELDVSVLIFDYRGYGKSEGAPTEQGVLDDARAARQWLARRAGIEPHEIVLMGRSLGTAIAVDLAADGGARGLVLESGFTSLPDVAAFHYPYFPVRLLMRTRLDSLQKIGRYHGPLLQCHADADEVIPEALGRKLFDASPSAEKYWVELTGNGHNDPHPRNYYEELDAFLARLQQRAASATSGNAGDSK